MRFFQFKLDEKVRPPRPQTGLDPERLKKIDRITRKLQSDPELVDEIFTQISTKAKDIEGNFINRFIIIYGFKSKRQNITWVRDKKNWIFKNMWNFRFP